MGIWGFIRQMLTRIAKFIAVRSGGTPPGPTLGALDFSDHDFVTGAPKSGTITGATSGSTISAVGLPLGFTINGTARTWGWDGTGIAGDTTFTLIETLAGAANTPHSSLVDISVNADSDYEYGVNLPQSGVYFNGMTAFADLMKGSSWIVNTSLVAQPGQSEVLTTFPFQGGYTGTGLARGVAFDSYIPADYIGLNANGYPTQYPSPNYTLPFTASNLEAIAGWTATQTGGVAGNLATNGTLLNVTGGASVATARVVTRRLFDTSGVVNFGKFSAFPSVPFCCRWTDANDGVYVVATTSGQIDIWKIVNGAAPVRAQRYTGNYFTSPTGLAQITTYTAGGTFTLTSSSVIQARFVPGNIAAPTTIQLFLDLTGGGTFLQIGAAEGYVIGDVKRSDAYGFGTFGASGSVGLLTSTGDSTLAKRIPYFLAVGWGGNHDFTCDAQLNCSVNNPFDGTTATFNVAAGTGVINAPEITTHIGNAYFDRNIVVSGYNGMPRTLPPGGITKFTMVHQNHPAGKIVHEALKETLRTMRVTYYRAMDLTNTNIDNFSPEPRKTRTAANRNTVAMSSWGAHSGPPEEWHAELMNDCNLSLHLNISHDSDSSFATAFAAKLRSLVPTGLGRWLAPERSNEVWNGQFGQCQANEAAAASNGIFSNQQYCQDATTTVLAAKSGWGSEDFYGVNAWQLPLICPDPSDANALTNAKNQITAVLLYTNSGLAFDRFYTAGYFNAATALFLPGNVPPPVDTTNRSTTAASLVTNTPNAMSYVLDALEVVDLAVSELTAGRVKTGNYECLNHTTIPSYNLTDSAQTELGLYDYYTSEPLRELIANTYLPGLKDLSTAPRPSSSALFTLCASPPNSDGLRTQFGILSRLNDFTTLAAAQAVVDFAEAEMPVRS